MHARPTATARPRLAIIAFAAAFAALAPFVFSGPPARAATNGPIASTALKYVGTHGGQCWSFMKDVVREATGRQVGFDYRWGYFEAGASEVSADEAANGDIIQIASDGNTSPNASYPGLHTAIILENLGGGVFNAVDSNQNWDEMVGLRPNYNPYTSAARYGLQVHIYRIPGGGPGGLSIDSQASAVSDWAAGDVAVVSTSGCLNVRSQPTVSSSRVGCLPAGASLSVTGAPVSADGYLWVPVDSSAGSVWVASQYLARTATGPRPAATAASESLDGSAIASASVAIAGGWNAHVDNSPGCLRVRTSAGLDGTVVDCLGAGNNVIASDGGTQADGYSWVQINVPGRVQGWVAGDFLIWY